MANIPTIPGSARVQDQQIGAKRDVTPQLRALGQLRQTVGAANNAVQEGMSAIVDYEEKKRKAEEAYVFNSSSLSFQKMHSDFLHNVKKTPDEQIVPNWTEQTQTWKQQQLDQYGSKLSPRATKIFNMNLDNAIGQSTAKFQVVADKLGSQRREGAAVANWNEFLKSGDPEMATKAMSSIKLAQAAGDITPEKVAYYQSQVQPVLQKNQILNGIDHDPYATLKDIDAGKFKSVPETELSTLRNTAEKQVNYLQRTTAGEAVNDYQTSGLPKSDKELADLKASGKVTGEFVKNYKAMVARTDYHTAQDEQALMLNRLRDMDLSDSDNPEKDVRQVTDEAASLPPQLQKEIHTLADTKLKAAKTGQRNEMHAEQLDLMRQAHEESMGRILISPRTDTEPARSAESVESIERMDDDKFAAEFGENADRKDVLKTAKDFEASEKLRYANAQKAFVNWTKTKKGAEATPEQAAAERERLGFGRYSTTDDVAAAYKAGKVDRGTAKEILLRQFGVP